MKIRIDNPTDSFDLFETITLHFGSTGGQNPQKTINIRWNEYKELDDGTFADANKPMTEFFIKNVDEFLISEAGQGRDSGADALGACMLFMADVLKHHKGIDVAVEV